MDQAATEYCSDVMQLKMCHMKCGHDGLCHQKCPLPKDEDLKAKVVEKMQCHDKCGADRECHQKCVAGGCPFRKVLEKCPMLKFEDPRNLGLSAGKMGQTRLSKRLCDCVRFPADFASSDYRIVAP